MDLMMNILQVVFNYSRKAINLSGSTYYFASALPILDPDSILSIGVETYIRVAIFKDIVTVLKQ